MNPENYIKRSTASLSALISSASKAGNEKLENCLKVALSIKKARSKAKRLTQ